MKINFFFRNDKVGFSIGKVFETISSGLEDKYLINKVYLPSPLGSGGAIIKNCYFAFKVAKSKNNKGGINHITGDVYYLSWILPKKGLVVTVHDIWFYTENKKSLKMLIKYILWIYPIKRAEIVTFVSEASKDQLLKYLPLNEEQIEIVENPVSQAFFKSNKPFNKEKPIILHLGMSYSKNLENLIPALKNIPCHLRLIGKLKDSYRKLLEVNSIEYSYAYNLTNEEVVEEYNKCDIVNLTSQHEGFGMPIVEGQKSNKIVITSNLSPMKEVAGEGAVFVDPYNIQDIHDAYNRVIQDDLFREKIRELGCKNVERFSIEKISGKYANVYNKIQNRNNF